MDRSPCRASRRPPARYSSAARRSGSRGATSRQRRPSRSAGVRLERRREFERLDHGRHRSARERRCRRVRRERPPHRDTAGELHLRGGIDGDETRRRRSCRWPRRAQLPERAAAIRGPGRGNRRDGGGRGSGDRARPPDLRVDVGARRGDQRNWSIDCVASAGRRVDAGDDEHHAGGDRALHDRRR